MGVREFFGFKTKAEIQAEYSRARSECAKLRVDNNHLTEELSGLKEDYESLKQEKATVEKARDGWCSDYENMAKIEAKKSEKIKELQKELDTIRTSYERVVKELHSKLAAADHELEVARNDAGVALADAKQAKASYGGLAKDFEDKLAATRKVNERLTAELAHATETADGLELEVAALLVDLDADNADVAGEFEADVAVITDDIAKATVQLEKASETLQAVKAYQQSNADRASKRARAKYPLINAALKEVGDAS